MLAGPPMCSAFPFYVWDLSDRFAADVVNDFVAEYAAGRTPNPCLRCNEKIKFSAVLDRGVALGFDAVCTGHYARLVRTENDVELHRAVDAAKDQSYVLGVLNQDQLRRSYFPLGGSRKAEVRAEAGDRGLAVADKPDSHDICFIADGDTAGFLSGRLGSRPGDIVDVDRRQGRRACRIAPVHHRAAAGSSARHAGRRRPSRASCWPSPRRRTPLRSVRDDALAVKSINAIRPTWTGVQRRRRVVRSGPGSGPRPAHGRRRFRSHDEHLECSLDAAAAGVAPGQAVVLYDGLARCRKRDHLGHPGVTASSSDGELPPIRTTGIGSWPGTDMADAIKIAFAECPDLPYLPELPARGPYAQLIGRSTAFLAGLAVDLQPAGWRLTDASSRDHRLAISTLRADLDQLEEHAQGYAGTVKLSVAGPWTLASMMERPRGDRVVADSGARRDLSQSLAEGIAQLTAELGRRLPDVELLVQLDEPMLPAVLGGTLATASGLSRHRPIEPPEVSGGLRYVVERLSPTPVVVHCCAAGPPVELLRTAGIAGVLVDIDQLSGADWDAVGASLEAGVWIGMGALPTDHGRSSGPIR